MSDPGDDRAASNQGPPETMGADPALRIMPLRHTLPRGVVIHRDRFEAVDRAERAVAAAQAEAERIRHAAEAEAAGLREEARREGYEAGRRELAAAEVALRAEALRLRAEAGERLLRLAVTLAERVLGQELRSQPEAVLALVRRALAQVAFCREAVVRLHPDDAGALAARYPALAAVAEGGAELRLLPDPALRPGDCLVETDGGQVDGSVRVLLASLEEALLAGSPLLTGGPLLGQDGGEEEAP